MCVQNSCEGLCGYQRCWISRYICKICLGTPPNSCYKAEKDRTIARHVTGLANLISWITFGITEIYRACQAEPKKIVFLLDSFITTSSQKVHTQDKTYQSIIIRCLAAIAPNFCPNDWRPHPSQANTCPWSRCLKCNSAKPAARSHGSQSFKIFYAYIFEILWNHAPFPAVKSESRWQRLGYFAYLCMICMLWALLCSDWNCETAAIGQTAWEP